MIKQDNILRFKNLSQFDSLTHGFSTKFFGDMRPSHANYENSLKKFSDVLRISPEKLIRMDQVHSANVYEAIKNDGGRKIEKTDGLVSEEKDIFLGVITADCLPLLFYDPKTNIFAAVHAGWRGLFSEIIKETVSRIVVKGSDPSDIIVGIGPSIRVCCYEVSDEFVANFQEKFSETEKFVERREGKIFFNLQECARQQLLAVHVEESNIEDGDYCTFTHEDIYSCRREGKDFGEMIGIIGLKK